MQNYQKNFVLLKMFNNFDTTFYKLGGNTVLLIF